MGSSEKIKVSLLSASDSMGGAGTAALRLLEGLKPLNVDPVLHVRDKVSDDPYVIGYGAGCQLLGTLLAFADQAPKVFYPRRHRDAWSCGFLPNPCLPVRRLNQADIIHLHWVGGGVLPLKSFAKLNKPIVWTLHDSWPFTGGCHIPYGCREYENKCGGCPQLKSGSSRDLSRLVWEMKDRAWRRLTMTIVAPSTWLASSARASQLFRNDSVEIIPNGLDVHKFSPMEKHVARRSLDLPDRAHLLLFSAVGGLKNWNKGGDLLRESLMRIPDAQRKDLMVVFCGEARAIPAGSLPVPIINVGYVKSDEVKRRLYAAADLTVVPSRSENLAYVVMESMACGTPCVAFRVGGMADLIEDYSDGVLVDPYLTEGFASAITWLLTDEGRRRTVAMHAREKVVAHFSVDHVARRYEELYSRLHAEHKNKQSSSP